MKRLTTKIKGSNNYCKFELKNAKYKNLFELSSNREIEDYVNSDLTIAIDKLGQLEDIEEKYNISSYANMNVILLNCKKFREENKLEDIKSYFNKYRGTKIVMFLFYYRSFGFISQSLCNFHLFHLALFQCILM